MDIIISIKGPVKNEADIIALKEALAYVIEKYDLTVDRIDTQEGEGMNIHDATELAYKRGRAEAIKEFVNRVKAEFGDDWCRLECSFNQLDQIAKEMGVE